MNNRPVADDQPFCWRPKLLFVFQRYYLSTYFVSFLCSSYVFMNLSLRSDRFAFRATLKFITLWKWNQLQWEMFKNSFGLGGRGIIGIVSAKMSRMAGSTTKVENLKFDNLALRTLPIDPQEEVYPRQVRTRGTVQCTFSCTDVRPGQQHTCKWEWCTLTRVFWRRSFGKKKESV